MKSKVYQFVLVHCPKDGKEVVIRPVLEQAVNMVLAKDDNEARMKASKQIPDGFDLDEVEVVIRPF